MDIINNKKDTAIETNTKKRNNCLFIFEILASIFIIFIHIKVPGKTGEYLLYFARFGVPLFYMVSGFYMVSNKDIDANLLRRKMVSKIIKLIILLIISSITYICLSFYFERNHLSEYYSEMFEVKWVTFYFLFNVPFFSFHHWFLLALIYVYLFVMRFPKLFIRKDIWLYLLGSIALLSLVLHIIAYQFEVATIFGSKIYTLSFFRNWYFNALPFVSLGMLIKRKIELLKRINITLVVIILILSGLLMIFEMKLYVDYLNARVEYCLSNIVFCISIFVLANKHPLYILDNLKLLKAKGNWPTFVYIFHPAFISIITDICDNCDLNQYDATAYIKPFVVIVISTMFAILFNYFYYRFENRFLYQLVNGYKTQKMPE